ncbi:NAD(P)H-dependent oxidoreductase [Micromonospora sp. CPCC 205539]|uniref:NADPH-dependent FMN reductase n=1 Tax=Micromonospora sp. CPCC 205539 TaxID=3122408 RepID=UPI002FF04442
MTPLRIAVIIGSTREGRAGDRVARWFVDQVERHDDLAVTVVDLTEYDFPTSYPAEPTASIRAFVREVGRADGFVVVTPEYNHSFPAPLKQAIDYAYDEWQAKPVGFVSYGCGSTGLHAVDQLRTVFTALHAMTVRDVVGIDLLGGEPSALGADELCRDTSVLLDQLRWWGLALRDGRAARPYVS